MFPLSQRNYSISVERDREQGVIKRRSQEYFQKKKDDKLLLQSLKPPLFPDSTWTDDAWAPKKPLSPVFIVCCATTKFPKRPAEAFSVLQSLHLFFFFLEEWLTPLKWVVRCLSVSVKVTGLGLICMLVPLFCIYFHKDLFWQIKRTQTPNTQQNVESICRKRLQILKYMWGDGK